MVQLIKNIFADSAIVCDGGAELPWDHWTLHVLSLLRFSQV